MKIIIKKSFILIVSISILTAINYKWFGDLGLTGVSMIYLLFVVGVAYHWSNFFTVTAAITNFLVINYFFVEPRFTFQVGHFASWASLISFLTVSAIITSLVKRLRFETFQSQQAYLQAEFLRKLAEVLSHVDDIQTMIVDCQELIKNEFKTNVFLIKDDVIVNGYYQLTQEQISAVKWVQENGKALGPGTNNWSNSKFVIVPFNRLPSHDPVLLIPDISEHESSKILDTIKLVVDQIAVAYFHILQKQKTASAENQAREESIRSALLASIAHDMRTPLTSILGAATTLNQDEISIDKKEMRYLTNIISSQAKHLARTTENILSLIRLQVVSKNTILLELQSPEEMLGTIIDLYKYQSDAPHFSVEIRESDLLINANHDLIVLALSNLIENAKQANMDNNRPNAVIKVIVGATEDRIFIQVHDCGRGFDEGFKASEIKKFQTSSKKGVGLGLSIVEAVARLHQAELLFEKGINEGAKVSLIFNKPKIDMRYV